MPKFKVVVTDDRFGIYEAEREVLKSIDAELTVTNCVTPLDVSNACKDADGVLVCMAPMPAETIRELNNCKVICKYGVGYDNVDVDACTDMGIQFCNVPDYCSEEVSDQALALLMACARKVARRDVQVREGQWDIFQADPVYRIAGKQFLLLGFGMIARCLLRKIRGFDLSRIMVYDPYVDKETIAVLGAEKVEWEEGIREADYISLHMPLTRETTGIINASVFEMMKPTVIIVNTSRGDLIDEEALIAALTDKRINSAGLDAFRKEPLNMDNPLIQLENCVLSDHAGWYSEESMDDLKRNAAENIKNVLSSRKPTYPVNEL